jgi:hypothetical protein
MTLILGTHTFAATGDAGRRQSAAMTSLRALRGVLPVNVQFASGGHEVEGIETLAVLERDACTVTGNRGPRKPIVSDILDALCARAEAAGASAFAFMNADIHLAQEAVEWIASDGHEVWLFSRDDYDGATGMSMGMGTAGMDVIVARTSWWRQHRGRFRPYIAGEAVWDNVYTAIAMCHADAVLENRRPLARHEAHAAAWTPGTGPYAAYTQYLAAQDAGYFSLWCRYWDGLRDLRRAGGTLEQEQALAREVFVWRPGAAGLALQGLRNLKAFGRYRLRLPRSSGAP